MWEVAAIARPFFPWPGNKVKLVPFIAPMIPPHVETFLEVFGGSAALSLALKPKKGRLDIYNDVDNDLFNVFCCIKENQHALAPGAEIPPSPWPGTLSVIPEYCGT